MVKKIISIWICVLICTGGLLVLSVFNGPINMIGKASGTTLYVNTTGSGGAFTSIQDAINISNDGDTVYIYNGSYYEHLTINKSINLTGENRNNTIIYGGFDGDGIIVESNWVNITSFKVKNVGHKSDNQAIEFNNVNNCSVTDMNISGNYEGLFLLFSENNNITNNIVQSNRYYGIYLSSSHNNVLSGSEFINNGHGLQLFHSDNNHTNPLPIPGHFQLCLRHLPSWLPLENSPPGLCLDSCRCMIDR